MMISSVPASLPLSLGSIIFVDLVLSGDNALVIGAALVDIPEKDRKRALIAGGGGAILLRILCTIFATFLLNFSYLQIVGGALVLYIAWRLIVEQDAQQDDALSEHNKPQTGEMRLSKAAHKLIGSKVHPDRGRFIMAIVTIVVADITMSLDNIIAVGALSYGNVVILSVGLIVSILFLLISSALVAKTLERLPGIIILASFILAGIAGHLILRGMGDLLPVINQHALYASIIVYALAFVVIMIALFVRRRHLKAQRAN